MLLPVEPGTAQAIAGRLMPRMRPTPSVAAAKIAPVEPAEKKPSASPARIGAHGLCGVLGHADDLGGDERLGAVVRLAERHHDVLVTRDQDAQVRVAGKPGLDAGENNAGGLVPAHGVDANGRHYYLQRRKKETDP